MLSKFLYIDEEAAAEEDGEESCGCEGDKVDLNIEETKSERGDKAS